MRGTKAKAIRKSLGIDGDTPVKYSYDGVKITADRRRRAYQKLKGR